MGFWCWRRIHCFLLPASYFAQLQPTLFDPFSVGNMSYNIVWVAKQRLKRSEPQVNIYVCLLQMIDKILIMCIQVLRHNCCTSFQDDKRHSTNTHQKTSPMFPLGNINKICKTFWSIIASRTTLVTHLYTNSGISYSVNLTLRFAYSNFLRVDSSWHFPSLQNC